MYKIVYFIGAGLTKALEIPEKPVPMMWDFVQTMAHYLDDPVVLAMMVELERADLYDHKSDEAASLAAGKFEDLSPGIRSAFKRALRGQPKESIETLLEKSLAPSANWSAQGVHQRFRYAINGLFYLVGWQVNWRPLARFLEMQSKLNDTEHTFVSFNYDLVLDRGVQQAFGWELASGYGIEIHFCVKDDLPQVENQAGPVESVAATPFESVPAAHCRQLKPHGSLNWLAPIRVPYEQAPEGLKFSQGPLMVPVAPDGRIRYWPSTHNSQSVTLPGEMPTEIGICILSPSSAKRSELPFLKRNREVESEAIVEAGEIFVIGWSLPVTDHDQTDLIRAAIGNRQKPLKQVTVVNRGADAHYLQRIAELFGVDPSSMLIHNQGFIDFVYASSHSTLCRFFRRVLNWH